MTSCFQSVFSSRVLIEHEHCKFHQSILTTDEDYSSMNNVYFFSPLNGLVCSLSVFDFLNGVVTPSIASKSRRMALFKNALSLPLSLPYA